MSALVLWWIACTTAPPAVPTPAPDGVSREVKAQAAKGAPMPVAAWFGPWSVVVYGEAGSANAAAFASALGTTVTAWDHRRPEPPAGTAALVWIDADTPIQGVLQALGQPNGAAGGEIDVVLDRREPAARDEAEDRLPWAGVGLLSAPSALQWWVAPGTPVSPAALPLAAAREVADHYGIAFAPCTGTLGDPVLDAALCPTGAMLDSPDVRVRAEARRALRSPGESPDAEVPVQLVQAAYGDQPLLSKLAALPSEDPLVQARIADRTDDVELLRRYAQVPSSAVRVIAANRLAHVAAGASTSVAGAREAAGAALAELAESPDAYVRWKAAWGLGRVRGSTGVVTRLLADVDIDVRREAAHSLGQLSDPASIPALLAAQHDANSFVRRWAADALRQFPTDPRAVAGLEAALSDPAGMVGMAAARALGRPFPAWNPPHPSSPSEAIQLLADPDPTTRKDACKFLAQVESADAQAALFRATHDEDSEVRKSAVEAIGWDAGAGVRDVLVASLQDPDPDVVVTALDAFRRRGDLRDAGLAILGASPAIARDGEVRLRLLEAMAASGEPAAGMDLRDERAHAAFVRAGLSLAGANLPASPGWLGRVAAHERQVTSGGGDAAGLQWELGTLAREDLLVHLRFSWTDEADRTMSHRALRDPVIREYGHPNRG